jgi:phosphopantetheinyl transferase
MSTQNILAILQIISILFQKFPKRKLLLISIRLFNTNLFMPLTHKIYLSSEVCIAVWRVTEMHTYFAKRLPPAPAEEQDLLARMQPKAQAERLASRYLLHLLKGADYTFQKDVFGKPFLHNSLNDNDFEISLSHSHGRVAVMYAPQACGIDIQKEDLRLAKLQNKFLSETEQNALNPQNPLSDLHVYWGAKEALYKAYGKRGVDFKTQLFVEPMPAIAGRAMLKTKGFWQKEGLKQNYNIFYKKISKYYLVFVVQNQNV